MSKNGYLQIHDPAASPKGHAVGIDLGHHQLAGGRGDPRQAAVPAGGRGRRAAAALGGALRARTAAWWWARAPQALAAEHPTDTIISVKRFMGKQPRRRRRRASWARYRFADGAGRWCASRSRAASR